MPQDLARAVRRAVDMSRLAKTKLEAMEILQRRQIPCGPILSIKELAEDPALRASGAVVEVDHPTRGTHLTVGNPVKLSDSLCTVTRAPLLGEHTREILREILDLSDDQIETLEGAGAFGEHGIGE